MYIDRCFITMKLIKLIMVSKDFTVSGDFSPEGSRAELLHELDFSDPGQLKETKKIRLGPGPTRNKVENFGPTRQFVFPISARIV